MRYFIVKQKQIMGKDVLLLTLTPYAEEDVFDFTPGQYVAIGFKHNARKTPMRSFSIVSSPRMPEVLQVAMRVKGNFTNRAMGLQEGDKVYVHGPFGDFSMNPDYDKRVIMMAGGIGITPMISMLRWATDAGVPINITLLYSCRSQDDIPFYDELLAMERRNPNLRVIFFVTGGIKQKPDNALMANGYITERALQQLTAGNFAGITYFLCGPKGFTSHLASVLDDNGVNNDRIVTESFSQSSKLFSFAVSPAQRLTYAFATVLLLAGIGGIAVLDLVRSVPKLVSAQSGSSAQTNTTAAQSDTSDPTASSDTSSSNTTDNSSTTGTTTNNTTTTTTATPTYTQTYSAPVSSVS